MYNSCLNRFIYTSNSWHRKFNTELSPKLCTQRCITHADCILVVALATNDPSVHIFANGNASVTPLIPSGWVMTDRRRPLNTIYVNILHYTLHLTQFIFLPKKNKFLIARSKTIRERRKYLYQALPLSL